MSGHITRGAVFSSGDEGRTWQLGALPSGFGVVWSGPSQVDCVTASTCWATGTAVAADPEFATGTALVSVVASSDDGGLTWKRVFTAPVVTLEPADGAAWAIADCNVADPSTSCVLYTSPIGSDLWSRAAVQPPIGAAD